ncbi:hypothetical protein GCM10011583_20040 [Streptomyces camponoticapitis]|uniref:Tat pathway signal sequence domain protein n=1 Tax=Streptomyces camponoticapitis TaxID=1616125 RepID=A0ABQ2E1W8_9ACTN|nr:DUF4429 domain-containing protein [Streptomyces camponoticapitis]GGJ88649.1 hypothetical protein GCM10011583_20040 [Streptomyces camponoticapitis]
MAEIIQRDGTWTFDGDTVRIVPGSDKRVSLLRKSLGEVAVPLAALAGITFEQGRKSGRLRLRLREGADPLTRVAGGKLDDASDPYQLTVESDRTGVAEYFVDEVRNALLLDEVESGPTDRFLLPGPSLPITMGAGDGTATFDGEQIRLEWNWKTEESKSSRGMTTLSIDDVDGVEWRPSAGMENGFLRFVVGRGNSPAPKYDPHSVELYGFRKDPLMALVAAAVVARLPHPNAAPAALPSLTKAAEGADVPAQRAASGDDHDALLRRLRELGELHQAGILTEEEFTTAKQAVLKRL